MALDKNTVNEGVDPDIDAIDRCLPQTQCTQCDFPRCRDYAAAIASGSAQINQCPPGGDVTIALLAELTGQERQPLNPEYGIHEAKVVARIDEPRCIGCRLCIKACPVDCIVGAAKRMHSVIRVDCTGCKLCIPVCPTDCIDLLPNDLIADEMPSPWLGFSRPQVERARRATEQKISRLERREIERAKQKRVRERARMQEEIMQAVKRQQAKAQGEPVNSVEASSSQIKVRFDGVNPNIS